MSSTEISQISMQNLVDNNINNSNSEASTASDAFLSSENSNNLETQPKQSPEEYAKQTKQYVLKTCRYVDKRCQELPQSNLFLTCLDVLIVESETKEQSISKNKYLASFNYFKRVTHIERRLSSNWLKVHLAYVTMKKIPVRVLQQRLKSTKTQERGDISELLETKLINYNRLRKKMNQNNMNCKNEGQQHHLEMTQSQLEKRLSSNNSFCYVLEIENTTDEEQKMDRLIYDFHITSIYFSENLSKFIAGCSSNLISYISSHGIPEIYSDRLDYCDFWKKRLAESNPVKNNNYQTQSFSSEIKTLENNHFSCQETIQFFTKSENPQTLLVVVSFELPHSAYNFMRSERKYLGTFFRSLKPQTFDDNNLIFQYTKGNDNVYGKTYRNNESVVSKQKIEE